MPIKIIGKTKAPAPAPVVAEGLAAGPTPELRIVPSNGLENTFYIMRNGLIHAMGCHALCQAVVNGTLPEYLEQCREDERARRRK